MGFTTACHFGPLPYLYLISVSGYSVLFGLRGRHHIIHQQGQYLAPLFPDISILDSQLPPSRDQILGALSRLIE